MQAHGHVHREECPSSHATDPAYSQGKIVVKSAVFLAESEPLSLSVFCVLTMGREGRPSEMNAFGPFESTTW